jgi:hypothetical protein
MTILALCAAVAMCAVLLWAALSKLVGLGGFASTLRAVGVPVRWSAAAALSIATAEAMTALLVVFAPGAVWTLAAISTLAAAFTVAATIALLRGARIRCQCFGSVADGYLGWMQVAALPLWIAGTLMLSFGFPTPPAVLTSASLFAAAALSIAAAKTLTLRGVVRAARADRLSAQEMYVWLPRH